jgi:hypothetical protein
VSDAQDEKTYSLEDALQAQKALRQMAGLQPEEFPVQAFVGMISDEIEMLRKQGRSDDEIATAISNNSNIKITADEIRDHYATPEERQQGAHG